MIFQNEKTPFQAIKKSSPKSPKIDIFPKGVNPWFWSKNGHFYNFLAYKKTPFQPIKTKSPKSRQIHIFPEGLTHSFGPKIAIFSTFLFRQYRFPWFWSKNGHVYNFLFQGIQARKTYFMIFQTKKTPLQAIKKKVQKVEKLTFFQKGLTHGFGPKMAIFPTFFLGKIGQENVFYDILERKNAFLGYENKESKKSKN